MPKANLKPNAQSEGFSELDWNFSQVQDSELVACCYWEYARESARIRAACDQNDVTSFPPASAATAHQRSANAGRTLDRARGEFSLQLWEHALPVKLTHDRVCETLRTRAPFEHPWLGLPLNLRSAVVEKLAPCHPENPDLPFLPFNRCPDLHDLGLAVAGYRCATLDAESGVEYLRVQIDWAGFTDAQIIAAFKVWLARNRPAGAGVAIPKGIRKQKGYRGYLAWLGMLRLMSICPFTSLEKEMPTAWRCYGKTDWPRARKKAAAVFKGLFPFLPREDAMIHWQTAGGRGK